MARAVVRAVAGGWAAAEYSRRRAGKPAPSGASVGTSVQHRSAEPCCWHRRSVLALKALLAL